MKNASAGISRVLLVMALLLAQQTALAHQLWHAAFGVPQATATVADNEPSGSAFQEGLCDRHSALGTVLGALTGAAALSLAAVPPETQFTAPRLPAASLAAPAPASRDPPVSL